MTPSEIEPETLRVQRSASINCAHPLIPSLNSTAEVHLPVHPVMTQGHKYQRQSDPFSTFSVVLVFQNQPFESFRNCNSTQS
jgi:hypothetical protein